MIRKRAIPMSCIIVCCFLLSFSVMAADKGQSSQKGNVSKSSGRALNQETEKKRLEAEKLQETELMRRMETQDQEEAAIQRRMELEEEEERYLADQMALDELVEKSRLCLDKYDFICSEKNLDAAKPLARNNTSKTLLDNALKLHDDKLRYFKEKEYKAPASIH